MKSFFYIFICLFLMFSCATPVPPSGGVKDIIPPNPKIIQPANLITNYKGDRIEFIFDEYIVYSSGLDKLLITPPMLEKPKVLIKGKKLIVKLPDNLTENTTYNISFLGAISDYNAGNTINILKYVFSTGNYIDSASITGAVQNAFNNKKMENITVGLYPINDTSILIKSKPLYLTQTDASGNFKIENVKEGYYKIAALEDKNLNFIFDQLSEKISIPSNPIFITNNTVLEQEINVFTNKSNTLVDGYKLLGNNSLYFNFTNEVNTISLDVIPYSDKDIVKMSSFNDTLYYYWSTDSLKSAQFLFNVDNGNLDTFDINFSKNKRDSILSIQSTKVQESSPLIIEAPLLINDIDVNYINIKDSLENSIDFTYEIDGNLLSIFADFQLTNNYSVFIEPSAIHYFNGMKNMLNYSSDFSIVEKVELGDLILSLNTELKGHLVLELLNNNEDKIEQYNISNLSTFTIKNLKEGFYFIRIYSDLNDNFKWNTGSFENNFESEPCLFFSPKIEMKANWDKEFTINF